GALILLIPPTVCVTLLLLQPSPTRAVDKDKADDEPKATRLTKDGDFKQHLQWSPDGKRFLMTRIHESKMRLWTMNADGTEFKKLLDPEPNTVHFDGHWSSDSKQIVFVLDMLKGTDGNLQINTINADGSDSKVLVPHKA